MQVTKATWCMRKQCVPGSLSSSPSQEPGNKAKVICTVQALNPCNYLPAEVIIASPSRNKTVAVRWCPIDRYPAQRTTKGMVPRHLSLSICSYDASCNESDTEMAARRQGEVVMAYTPNLLRTCKSGVSSSFLFFVALFRLVYNTEFLFIAVEPGEATGRVAKVLCSAQLGMFLGLS